MSDSSDSEIPVTEVAPTKVKKTRQKRTKAVFCAPLEPVTDTEKPKKTRKPRKKKEAIVDPVVDTEAPTPVAKAKKPKRAPSAYNQFVSAQMKTKSIKALPQKERFAAISALWKKQKA